MSIDRLPGAGPVTAARLSSRGLGCVRDLLFFFPRAYEDYRRVYALSELAGLAPGTAVVVRGPVVRVHKFFRRMLDVHLEENGASLRARWFRPNAGMAKAYVRGERVALAGSLRRTDDGPCELIHPSNVTAMVGEAGGVGIRPRYPLVEKVPGRTVEKLIGAALSALGPELVDPLPAALRARLGLPELEQALSFVHQPPSSLSEAELAELSRGASPAQRRFAFEEILVLQLGLLRERRQAGRQKALACQAQSGQIWSEIRAGLPFSLTDAQERAVAAIFEAMSGQAPMQCLLQGDVGSGKTAVVFAACVRVARAGGQSLLMAPTAVLAEQHLRTLTVWGARARLRVGLLHAGLAAAEQRRILDQSAAGELDVLVGTHALLDDRLRLSRLALAVVDEQHRFGVRQRARLRRVSSEENGWQIAAQDGIFPHLLVLSATPIPRSLALTVYGDLDLVTLDAMPPGRKPVATHVCVGADARAQAYARVEEALKRGEQTFVVCPAVREGTSSSRKPSTVHALARELRTKHPTARIGVLHGQLAGEAQRLAVEKFRDRALDILVATTVLEVGVDVPSASLMVVEDAERFGLAQLHQLRGRVGRGGQEAHCYLLTSSEDAEARERLRVVASEHDGFRIAEEDLRRRGVGDLQGTRQTGMPELRFADLATYAGLVELGRREAEAILAVDPELVHLEHRGLAQAVAERLRCARPIAEEAG